MGMCLGTRVQGTLKDAPPHPKGIPEGDNGGDEAPGIIYGINIGKIKWQGWEEKHEIVMGQVKGTCCIWVNEVPIWGLVVEGDQLRVFGI